MLALAVLLLTACGGQAGLASADTTATQAPTTTVAPPTGNPAGNVPPPAGRGAGGTQPSRRPNIVLVLTDDLSWNLVPYMPAVRAMQREGVTFDHYFVSDSLCCPSRASIFSGRLPHDTRVYSNTPPWGGFDVFHSRHEQTHTFATALRRAGYRTAMMGKYLNGYKPTMSFDGSGPYVPPGWSEWDVAGDGYPEFHYSLNENGRVVHYGNAPGDYLTDVISNLGGDFIDQSARAGRPFLLELATFAPHAPYVPAPRDANKFPTLTAPRTPAFDAPTIAPPPWLAGFPPLSPDQLSTIDQEFRLRVQDVQSVNRMLNQVRARLRADGIERNTYIIFSSDNGFHMGEHRLAPGKLTAFDTDIRVPLIVVGPGVPAGRHVGALAENIDLCPTFERLGHARVSPRVDGRSLVALMHGRPPRHWRSAVLIEHHHPRDVATNPDRQGPASGNPPSYEALRTRNALYVQYADGEHEYYNLRTDPFELHNLATHLSPQHSLNLERRVFLLANCHDATTCSNAPPTTHRPRRRRHHRHHGHHRRTAGP